MDAGARIIVGVGAVIFRGDEIALVRRAKPPFEGEWSIPGGRLRVGERLKDAVLREVKEETGLDIRIGGLIGVFENPPFLLIDYWADWTGGAPAAGGDALDAAFMRLSQALPLVSWSETRRAIEAAAELRDTVKNKP